jgi:hypothetical protein
MSVSMELRWVASERMSCLHAAEALWQGQELADTRLADVLAAPVEKLRATLWEESVPGDVFFSHLCPVADAAGALSEVAEVVLIKTIGRTEAGLRVHRFRRVLNELNNAFGKAVPECRKMLLARLDPIRRNWNYQGTSLLGGIAGALGPEVLADEATVVLVHPACGGGGKAHLSYNLARLEAVSGDPVAELPEVVRLAWLLSMLNLDLPRFSEKLRTPRVPIVAALAMIPIVLTAAEIGQLAACNEAMFKLAIESWLPSSETDAWLATLCEWWEVYRTMRPPWDTALQALDRLVGEPSPCTSVPGPS